MKIIALTTCHNRRDITLRALDSLHKQSLPAGYSLDICLVDDGSTDGTSEAVKSAYPGVIILKGTGELYWAGGMRFGWEHYVKQQDFDFLLVFNDDVLLLPDALNTILATSEKLKEEGVEYYSVVGTFKEEKSDDVAYGGVIKKYWWHPLRFRKVTPNNLVQKCDTLNMNFALIPKKSLDNIGFLSDEFIHGKADYDFGLRLKKNGGSNYISPGYVGICEKNSTIGTSLEKGISLGLKWRRLTSLKEQHPRQRKFFYKRHAGFFWLLFWVAPYIRMFFGRK